MLASLASGKSSAWLTDGRPLLPFFFYAMWRELLGLSTSFKDNNLVGQGLHSAEEWHKKYVCDFKPLSPSN